MFAIFMALFIVVFKLRNSVTAVEGHECHCLKSRNVFSSLTLRLLGSRPFMLIFVSVMKACDSQGSLLPTPQRYHWVRVPLPLCMPKS